MGVVFVGASITIRLCEHLQILSSNTSNHLYNDSMSIVEVGVNSNFQNF